MVEIVNIYEIPFYNEAMRSMLGAHEIHRYVFDAFNSDENGEWGIIVSVATQRCGNQRVKPSEIKLWVISTGK